MTTPVTNVPLTSTKGRTGGATSGDGKVDGARLAVLANRLDSIVRRMENTLQRSARSGVISVARDFSCCVLTPDCDLLASGDGLPIHVMAGTDEMCRTMMKFHPDFRRGDAFLHNSPYHGNTHAADHAIIVPVFDDEGVHRLTVLAKAHQADCGNSIPTTYMDSARDVYHEGALIFPAVQVQRDYRDIDDIIRMCLLRIRVPDQWLGDFRATVGAARIGEREFQALGREMGWDTLEKLIAAWFDYSETRMRDVVRRLPSGSATAATRYDPIPEVPEGVPIKASVRIDAAAGTVHCDLTDNPDCLPCGLNLTEATSRTAAMIGIFNSIDHTVPKNAGSFRCIEVKLRENCVVGIPRHPASCSVATTNISDRVIAVVQRALSELGEGIGMAEAGYTYTPAAAVISGNDPRHEGKPFVNQIMLGDTVGPGGPHADGWLTFCHAGNAGLMYYDSVEVDELHHPIRIEERRIIPDSEGPGRLRSAPAQRTVFAPVGTDLRVIYASDGMINLAAGARGGGIGTAAGQWRQRFDGALEPLPASGDVTIAQGESVVCRSSSGGGYGPAHERDPARVARDVREGYVSRARAQSVYGVVLDANLTVDEVRTNEIRASLERRRG